MDVGGHVAGREGCAASVVDVDPAGRHLGKFSSVEPGKGDREARPRLRVGRSFAGEVAGIELSDGGVEVVEVEDDDRRNLFRRS